MIDNSLPQSTGAEAEALRSIAMMQKGKVDRAPAKGEEAKRADIDGEKLQHGIAKLILTLVEVITEILERQALRRVTDGSLDDSQIERMGMAFTHIRKRMDEVVKQFGFTRDELNLDLGPLGTLRNGRGSAGSDPSSSSSISQPHVSLVGLIDRLIDQGTLVAGEVTISVANVDLVVLNLMATLSSVQRLKEPHKDYGARLEL